MTFQHEEKEPFFFPLQFLQLLGSRQKVSNGIAASCTVQRPSQSGEEKRNGAETFTVYKKMSFKMVVPAALLAKAMGQKKINTSKSDKTHGNYGANKNQRCVTPVLAVEVAFLWKTRFRTGSSPVVTLSTE